jgi:hypothetical protein
MNTSTVAVQGMIFNEVMKEVDLEIRKQVEDALIFFANDADQSAAAEKTRSDKLKTAYTALAMFLISNKLNQLNKYQVTFLCTGAIGDSVEISGSNGSQEINLLPKPFYEYLFNASNELAPEKLEFPIYTVLERFEAIAKGDMLAFEIGDERKRALRNSPQDQKRFREDVKRKLNLARMEVITAINQLDIFIGKALDAFSENKTKTLKTNLELMKKVGAAWGHGDDASPQEKAILKAFEFKLGDAATGIAKWSDESKEYLRQIAENAVNTSEKFQVVMKATSDLSKIMGMMTAGTSIKKEILFDAESISNIKKDVDTCASVSIRVSENSPLKVAFSTSRILVRKQFLDGVAPVQAVCTRQAVMTSLKKALSIHTNLFPKGEDGLYIIPFILIEPLRNFVDFFEDRFIVSFVSGEAERKGPIMTFTPVDMQVLKLCALYLTKDPIYDYRGNIKAGTFMGDYVGRVEKQTKVKWTGQDKKFTLAATQSLEDEASRDDAISDYLDFIVSVSNNIAPSPKLSKRRISTLLKYVLFDKIEKNIASVLKLVSQQEPAEAKETIMFFAKEKPEVAKDMIKSAMAFDPLASKLFSDNPEFAYARILGRG